MRSSCHIFATSIFLLMLTIATMDVGCSSKTTIRSQLRFLSSSGYFLIDVDGTNLQQILAFSTLPSDAEYFAWSKAGDVIAFTSKLTGNTEIYVLSINDRKLHRLTNGPTINYAPMWAPNGYSIAFQSRYDQHRQEVSIVDADGANLRRLTNYDHCTSSQDWNAFVHTWSPDSRSIVFGWTCGQPGLNYDGIDRINVDGTKRISLFRYPEMAQYIVWSPNGHSIAYISNQGYFEIYVVNADGTNKRKVTNSPRGAWGPSWSPNGQSIAFQSERDGNLEIYVMNSDSTNQRRLTHNDTEDAWPTWSLDSQLIAFVSQRDGGRQIYLINPDGTGEHRLVYGLEETYAPVWLAR